MAISNIWRSCVEYDTPRLVKIRNRKLGLLRRLIQFAVIIYVAVFALWLSKGYQEFTTVESSVTTKVKGVTMSHLNNNSTEDKGLYTRLWDEADYVVPPAENGAFFVATNVVVTPNQSRGRCPEDEKEIDEVLCEPDPEQCQVDKDDFGQWRHKNRNPEKNLENSTLRNDATEERGTRKCKSLTCIEDKIIFKAHGPMTGFCVKSDRPNSDPKVHVCEIESWCPIEIDKLPLGKTRALMSMAEDYTVFVKNSIAFPFFGSEYVRNNLVGEGGKPCQYNVTGENNGCQIFRLGDIVAAAGGNFSQIAINGGVVSMSISWNCDLDLDFMKTCLPEYSFRILDDRGWNFREAKYHEENRRTLYKLYGIKFIITVDGRGGKFSLKNTILNIGSGLALLGVSTIICDFMLMYIKESVAIRQKKYDYINYKRKKGGVPSSINEDTQMAGYEEDCFSSISSQSHLGYYDAGARRKSSCCCASNKLRPVVIVQSADT